MLRPRRDWWAASDAPSAGLAPCKMLISLFRQRDEGVRPQRGPQDQGVCPTNPAVVAMVLSSS
jgi:hypothetical protein